MRIISKHHDYYDGALWYDTDPKCIYIRKMEVIERPPFPIDVEFSERMMDYTYYIRRRIVDRSIALEEQGLVFFCGIIVPYIMLRASISKWGSSRTIFCYSIEEVLNFFKKYGNKHDAAYLSTEARSLWLSRKASKNFTKTNQMAAFFVESPKSIIKAKVVDHHFTMKAPYFLVKRAVEGNKRQIIVNPVLKDLQFFKRFIPPIAAQEIEMFIGGVFGNQAPPMIQISDDIRLAKHGFDKWSFRKEK